jgi:hypothetical protein
MAVNSVPPIWVVICRLLQFPKRPLCRFEPSEEELTGPLEWPMLVKGVDHLDQIPTTIIEATVYRFVRQFHDLLDNSVTANIPKD